MNKHSGTLSRRALPRGNSARRMRGLSIVELMVAIGISVVIMMALVRVFVSNRVAYQADEGLARLQENARFAVEFLARDIRAAGNMGCLGNMTDDDWQDKVISYLAGPDASQTFAMRYGVFGWDASSVSYGLPYTLPTMYPPATTTTANPSIGSPLAPTNPFVQGSDLIILRSMEDGGVKLLSPYHDDASVFASRPNSFNSGDIMMLTDCVYAAIFQATNVSPGMGGGKPQDTITHTNAGNPGNICSVWGSPQCPQKNRKGFGPGSHFASMRTVLYFVGPGQYGGPSLFRRTFTSGNGIDEELVEGIENLQILYGVDIDGDATKSADRFLPASQIIYNPMAPKLDQWLRVQSVRISMLVATSNVRGGADTPPDTEPYMVQGSMMTPNTDNRRRRVFDATVEIRNRL